MQSSQKILSGRPILFGEVLYDVFQAENQKVLGGAPFNVAWHLQGFGLQPFIMTRIGQDTAGEDILQTMQQWGMETHLVQQDTQHPTGQVLVSLQAGSPHFEIPSEQAYDYLEPNPVLTQPNDYALFYHGTLALRHEVSRTCWQTVVNHTRCPIFLDINLRSPWWERDFVKTALKTATWLKVNEDELTVFSPHFKTATVTTREVILEDFCQQYDLEMIIVTLGEKGALLKQPQEPLLEQSPPAIQIVDSVGAGDAFSAMCIAGLLRGWPAKYLLEQALLFAAAVCQIRGATTIDQGFYHQATALWRHHAT
jgi:fructokinase